MNKVEHKTVTKKARHAVECLFTAERSWDKWIADGGHTFNGYPTEVQVVAYLCAMQQQRQRVSLAQRQNKVVSQYNVAKIVHLWPTKYSAFGKLDAATQKSYWDQIVCAHKCASASKETQMKRQYPRLCGSNEGAIVRQPTSAAAAAATAMRKEKRLRFRHAELQDLEALLADRLLSKAQYTAEVKHVFEG